MSAKTAAPAKAAPKAAAAPAAKAAAPAPATAAAAPAAAAAPKKAKSAKTAPKKKSTVQKFTIDCSEPAADEIFDIASFVRRRDRRGSSGSSELTAATMPAWRTQRQIASSYSLSGAACADAVAGSLHAALPSYYSS